MRLRLTWKITMVEKFPFLHRIKTLTRGRSTRFQAFCILFNMNGPDSKWTELIGMSKKPNYRYISLDFLAFLRLQCYGQFLGELT